MWYEGAVRSMRNVATMCVGAVLVAALSSCVDTQTWSGIVSDSSCGGAGHLWDEHGPPESPRECALRCIREGARFVFVSEGTVYEVANQDFAGLEEHAGTPVTLGGRLDGGTITVRAIEAVEAPGPDQSPDSGRALPGEHD